MKNIHAFPFTYNSIDRLTKWTSQWVTFWSMLWYWPGGWSRRKYLEVYSEKFWVISNNIKLKPKWFTAYKNVTGGWFFIVRFSSNQKANWKQSHGWVKTSIFGEMTIHTKYFSLWFDYDLPSSNQTWQWTFHHLVRWFSHSNLYLQGISHCQVWLPT